ncbi:MAG: hypothetical protein U0167_15165 [bacterium]
MNARTMALGAMIGLVTASAAWGEELTASLRDVTVVQDGHGSARVFFRLTPIPFSERTVLERAVLTVPYAGTLEDRAIELRVCPVTRAWAGNPSWDTPFDRTLYARARVDLRAAGVAALDLTVALKESLEHGVFADGFVLMARTTSEGVPAGDLVRFAGLSAARVHVTTSVLPSGRAPAEGGSAMRRTHAVSEGRTR